MMSAIDRPVEASSLKRDLAHMLAKWESSDELAGEFADKLIAFFHSHLGEFRIINEEAPRNTPLEEGLRALSAQIDAIFAIGRRAAIERDQLTLKLGAISLVAHSSASDSEIAEAIRKLLPLPAELQPKSSNES